MAFDFKRELTVGCKGLGFELDAQVVEQLHLYFNELKKWSKKVNLIAKGTGDFQILENHFVDSLALLKQLDEGAALVDIGTGAGFPGLVCKVVRPDMKLYLVEPRAKRVSFLNHISRTLALKNVEVKCSRIEDEIDFFKSQTVTHITCRAVSDLATFIEMTSIFDGAAKRLCLKGPKWKEELVEAEGQLAKHNLMFEKVDEYQLPVSGAERAIVVLTGSDKI